MKNLPIGNAALSIAHPSHEIRLHGFLSRTKPFIFLMTDGSGRNNEPTILFFQEYIKKIHRNNRDAFALMQDGEKFIQDNNIYTELIAGRHQFFEIYTKSIAKHLLRKKIDYVVVDSSEGYNVSHEMCHIMTNLAIKYVQKMTGKKIMSYDFAITEPYSQRISEDCIHIELSDEEYDYKLNAFANYHPSLFAELKNNISLIDGARIKQLQSEGGIQEIKQMIALINSHFIRNEYLRPYIYEEPAEAPFYEKHGEQLAVQGVYAEIIRYEQHIKPIKEKLESILLGNPVISRESIN